MRRIQPIGLSLRSKDLPLRTKFHKIAPMQQPALELVISALQKIRESNGCLPRASRAVLEQLRLKPTGEGERCADKDESLAAVNERVRACVKCQHLACSRTQTVFGVGNSDAELMFVGEAPGADEDAQGEPFVGRAGQLLTKIIKAMGFAREDVYIANILKCRPDMPAGSFGNR